jgi:hypothetical protein
MPAGRPETRARVAGTHREDGLDGRVASSKRLLWWSGVDVINSFSAVRTTRPIRRWWCATFAISGKELPLSLPNLHPRAESLILLAPGSAGFQTMEALHGGTKHEI